MLRKMIDVLHPKHVIPVHFGTFEHYVEPVSEIQKLEDKRIIIPKILVVSKNPLKNRTIILLNGIGRLSFALIIAYYVFAADLIRIIVAFGIIDVTISIGFLYYLKKTKTLEE